MQKPGLTRRGLVGLSGGAALAGALGGVGELVHSSSALRAEQAGDPVIDTHIHVVIAGLPGIKPGPEEIDRLFVGPPPNMAERVKAEMEQANVQIAFGMGSLLGEKHDPLGVARILELAKSVPGLKAIGALDPRRTEPEHLKSVEAQIEQHRGQIVALKAYLGYLHFGPEDPKYVPYYKIAAKYHLPVIFHTGDNWSTTAKLKYAHPLRVDEVAVDHPDVRFVLAHLGNPWLFDAAAVIYKNTNVWADLSGLFVGSNQDINDLIDGAKVRDSAVGLAFSELNRAIAFVADYKKFLYGSDWPLPPMASYRRVIEALIPEEHRGAVFRTNAEHVFGLGR